MATSIIGLIFFEDTWLESSVISQRHHNLIAAIMRSDGPKWSFVVNLPVIFSSHVSWLSFPIKCMIARKIIYCNRFRSSQVLEFLLPFVACVVWDVSHFSVGNMSGKMGGLLIWVDSSWWIFTLTGYQYRIRGAVGLATRTLGADGNLGDITAVRWCPICRPRPGILMVYFSIHLKSWTGSGILAGIWCAVQAHKCPGFTCRKVLNDFQLINEVCVFKALVVLMAQLACEVTIRDASRTVESGLENPQAILFIFSTVKIFIIRRSN